MTRHSEFHVNRPDPARAMSLVEAANEKARAEDLPLAIRLVEEALRFDQIAALDGVVSMRARFCATAGNSNPKKAVDLYSQGVRLRDQRRYRDAALLFHEATKLDPLDAWSFNNLAWLQATCEKVAMRNGRAAIENAIKACKLSDWGCWAFIATLAAAYAEAGDFAMAIGWQKASLTITPDEHRFDAELILRHFEMRQPFVDEGMPPAAGEGSPRGKHLSDADPMSELIDPSNVSLDLIRDIYRAACLECERHPESENGLVISESNYQVAGHLDTDNDCYMLLYILQADPENSESAYLAFANRISRDLRYVRAAVHQPGVIVIDYQIPLRGGVTRRTMVQMTRQFVKTIYEGIWHCDQDGLFQSSNDSDLEETTVDCQQRSIRCSDN